MRWPFLGIFIFIISCSHQKYSPYGPTVKKSDRSVKRYHYRDVTGEYFIERKSFIKKNRLVTKVQMFNRKSGAKPVEQAIVVSKVGSVKSKVGRRVNALLPDISQYELWLEGKKYFSQIKVKNKRPSIEVILRSPKEKWFGKKEIPIYNKGAFCYFSQLIECLKIYGVTQKAIRGSLREFSFYIIRDQYPYFTEHLTQVSPDPIIKSSIRYRGRKKNFHRFEVEFDGHTLLYDIDEQADLAKLFWVAQGITMTVI